MSLSGISTRNEIDFLFHKIMSPIKKDADPNLVAQFCQKLNSDLDGAHIAIDLITQKIQSSQEWEALIALYILEACVKNCGEPFHDLVGRFRFLNEMIKLVSPKYLANKTSEKVKKKCIELIYCWSEGLPEKTKIKEAYDMLKRQGIVQQDPTYVDKLVISVPPRPINPIFDDEEKSKQLARLLKSKNPHDLELANRLIKNMVKQDEIKTEKISTRINELEHINNNIKLLNEMLLSFSQGHANDSEKETIKYLYEELEKLRPNLVKLATETDDNDDAIFEILKTNDDCDRIINQYKLMFLRDTVGANSSTNNSAFLDDVKLFDLTNNSITEDQESNKQIKNLLNTNDDSTNRLALSNGKSNSYDPLKELQDLFSAPIESKSSSQNSNTLSEFSNLFEKSNNYNNHSSTFNSDIFSSLTSTNNNTGLLNQSSHNLIPKLQQPLVNSKPSEPPKTIYSSNVNANPIITPQLKALNDLDELGRCLMEKSLNDPSTPLNAAVSANSENSSVFAQQRILSLNEIQLKKSTSMTSQQLTQEQNNENKNNNNNAQILTNSNINNAVFNELNNLTVELESINPGTAEPFNLYDKNNLKLILHFGRDQPIPDVYVVVISVTSSDTQRSLKNFSFQVAVPKSMKVKLQPASRSDLPKYNPILPPQVITQIMLIANPSREQIRLRYKLNYSFDESNFNEIDEVKSLPVSMDLL